MAEARKMKKKTYCLNLTTVVFIVVFSCFMVGYFVYSCAGNFSNEDDWEHHTQNVQANFLSVSFLVLGLVFFATGACMISSLKKHFPQFEK